MDDDFGVVSLGTDSVSWPTRLSRTRMSSVQGLSLGDAADTIATLEDVLSTVQRSGLKRYKYDSFESQGQVGEGESFSVDRCLHGDRVAAVKHIKLNSLETNSHTFSKRLRTVLNEIRIMYHAPLRDHPNIISVLGYGWRTIERNSLPYVVVEYGQYGTLRQYLTETPRPLGTKIILAGDVAAGITSLHQCDIIHGDIKLENIVVLRSWDRPPGVIAKLCDFGHSIILDSEKRNLKYYGTSMYNAPEVGDQDDHPLPPESLVKCDLWAFALALWEILDDGKVFLKKEWREEHQYRKPEKDWPISLISMDEQGSIREESLVNESERVFGRFDLKHLANLGKEFINSLYFGSAFADKGCLRFFINQALQIDPLLRPSSIRLGPVMARFNPSDINELQAKLAIHTGTSEWSFDLLKPDQEKEILWEHQTQILRDFEKIATRSKPTDASPSAAFQVAMCYMLGFGACKDSSFATKFLQLAQDLGHVVAKLFGPQLQSVMAYDASSETSSEISSLDTDFTSRVIRGLQLDPPNQEMVLNLTLTDRDPDPTCDQAVSSEEDCSLSDSQPNPRCVKAPTQDSSSKVTFQNYEELKTWLYSSQVNESTYGELETAVLILSSSKMSILECAILHRDQKTVDFLITNCPRLLDCHYLRDSLLVTACRTTCCPLVELLIRAGLNPSTERGEDSDSIFHWLFMLGENQSSILPVLLKSVGKNRDVLDTPSLTTTNISPQWPLRFTGTPLAFAVTAGSVSGVETLLRLGANPLAKIFGPTKSGNGSANWTPVHLAVKFHSVEMLSLVLADVEGCRTRRILSSAKKRLGSQSTAPIRKLSGPRITAALNHLISLQQSEDIWRSDIGCMLSLSTIIERMAMNGNNRNLKLAELVQLLPLSCLAAPSKRGSVSLMQAIDFQDVSVVEAILIAHPTLGSTVFRDPLELGNFVYPIHFASQMASHRDAEDSLDIVKLLVGLEPDIILLRDSQGRTPLHFAVTGSSNCMAKWLIKHGASVHATTNGTNHTCQTALHVVRMASTMSVLIAEDADINQQDKLGRTLAHIAALSGQEELLKAVIDSGARMEMTDNLGQTLIHCAVVSRSTSILTMLLGKGMDVNAKTIEGTTPLHLAVQSPRSDIFRILIDHGADIASRTRSLSTPLDLCVLAGNDVCLKPLLAVIKSRNPALINARDIGKRTPLHTAATFGRSSMVLDLLTYRADPSLADDDGNTPLHLLVTTPNEHIRRSQGDKLEFCALLCKHLSAENLSSSFLAKNKAGATPWDLAYENDDLSLIEIMFQYGGYVAYSKFIHKGEYVGSSLLTKSIQLESWDLVILLIEHHETFTRHPNLIYGSANSLRSAARLSDRLVLKTLCQSLITGVKKEVDTKDSYQTILRPTPYIPGKRTVDTKDTYHALHPIPYQPDKRTVETDISILWQAPNLRYRDGVEIAGSIKSGDDEETIKLVKGLPSDVAVNLKYLRCFGEVAIPKSSGCSKGPDCGVCGKVLEEEASDVHANSIVDRNEFKSSPM